MKKLILIVSLSCVGTVISSDTFPHISRHFPVESLLRQQCEENGRRGLSDEGAILCKQIDNGFSFVVKQIHDQYKKPLNTIGLFFRIDQPALLMTVREEMRNRFNTKAYREGEVIEIEAILGHLKLSEIDKRKECRFLRDFYVMAAEEGLRE